MTALDAGFIVNILQFNVLADALIDGFTHVADSSILEWDHRWPLIQKILARESYDFICLQEVDHYEDYFAPFLSELGYDGIFCQRRLEEAPISKDGAALFWNRHRFAPVDASRTRKLFLNVTEHSKIFGLMHVFSPLYEDVSSSCGGRDPSLEGEGETFYRNVTVGVACVHLSAKDKEAERLEEIESVLHATELILPSQVTFIVGDFNDTPDSAVCEKLKSRGYLGNYAQWSTWKRRATGEVKRTIDQVWHNPRKLRVTVLKHWSPKIRTCIPTARHPSDHLPLSSHYLISQQ